MNMESTHNSEGSSHGENTNSSQQKEDNLEVHGQWNQNGEVAPLTAEKVRSAAKAGLATAATKAKLFADHEEREIQRLSANIINHQERRLKKLFDSIPSLDELHALYSEGLRADVIVVDDKDKKLSMLKQLTVTLVKGLNSNPAAVIKKIAG